MIFTDCNCRRILKDNKYLESFGQDTPIYKGKNVKALQPVVHGEPMKWNRNTDVYAREALYSFNEIIKHTLDFNTALRQGLERADKTIQERNSK